MVHTAADPDLALFERHRLWALRIAGCALRRLPRYIQPDEIESAALEGLWRACPRWDGLRPFHTFAAPRITGAIKDYLRGLTGCRRRHPLVATRLPPVVVDRRADAD